ncbi:MAG: aminopeptidase P family protein [Phycisphaeraceae bacterium]|nr:aminopeptidase P family protein [Phycisphaeraceae bacterium]
MSDSAGSPSADTALLMAGVPASNLSLFHRVRFRVGDPTAYLELPKPAKPRRIFICRDIELDRAQRTVRADACAAPRDLVPAGELSADREIATAQAVVACLRRAGLSKVRADRSLPLIYAHVLAQAGVEVECDPDLGVLERRRKDAQELAWLDEAQVITESIMERTCRLIARATASRDGILHHDGAPLTSERIFTMIDLWCMEAGCDNPGSIVACGPIGGDCHDHGHGELRVEQPIIVDIFPRVKSSGYNGDCTRVVVHGNVPPRIAEMHAAVIEAKEAAERAIRPGVSADAVHGVTVATLAARGFPFHSGGAPEGAGVDWCGLVHGTGHGLGLSVHEPPLVDRGGPDLVEGDVITVEPGLYSRELGGVRIEDVVVVEQAGARRLGRALQCGLVWA